MIRDSVFAVGSEYLPLKLGAFLSKHSPHGEAQLLVQAPILLLAFSHVL